MSLLALPCMAVESDKDFQSKLTPLIHATMQRLSIAEQVALSKFSSGKAVEDKKRESEVLLAAANHALDYKLSREKVALFFSDQIEASKLIQYVLIAKWLRTGSPPSMPSLSLTEVIRPQLDALQVQMLQALSATVEMQQHNNCRTNLSKAIMHYAQESHHLDALYSIALERALANTCE